MIARIKDAKLKLESIEILGNWVLVKPFMDEVGGIIIIPDAVKESGKNDLIQRYRAIQIGEGVDIGLKVGEEVSLARSRCNPIYIETTLYGFVEKSFIYGSIETDEQTK
jgi:hypothetical protein